MLAPNGIRDIANDGSLHSSVAKELRERGYVVETRGGMRTGTAGSGSHAPHGAGTIRSGN